MNLILKKERRQIKPMGNKRLYHSVNRDVEALLRHAFAMGCTDAEACLYAGISRATFRKFCNGNPEHLESFELLKHKPILLARQSVLSAIANDPYLAFKFLEKFRLTDLGEVKEEKTPIPTDDYRDTPNITINIIDGTFTPVDNNDNDTIIDGYTGY